MKNIFHKRLLFTIIINLILIINAVELTPLSQCTKGRISPYNNWQNGGSCGFGSHSTATGATYIYPVAPNQDLFGNSAQCGVCYEMVGPSGVIKVRVEDYCLKNNTSGYCYGDMFHFNLANNGVSYIMGNESLSNITFRMVSCDYTGNIRILTDKSANSYYLKFVVLDHNLAVSNIQILEYNSYSWNNITRDPTNNWIYSNFDTGINLPLNLRIYSINGDYVQLSISSIEGNKYYDFNSNFVIPNDNTLFNISTLNKISTPDGYNKSKCCERDKSDFTPIYKDGIVNGGYNFSNLYSTINYYSTDIYLSKYSLNAKLNNGGTINFIPYFPIRADQYTGISFRIKFNSFCNNLYLRYYNKTSILESKIISIAESTYWTAQSYNFDDSVISNNEFDGIQFVTNTMSNCEINIEDIELIPNLNAPDAGKCYSNSTSTFNSTNSESETTTNTIINNIDIINSNYITINNIIVSDNDKNTLNVNCDKFYYSDNKKLKLIFTAKNNNNNTNTSYTVNNCTLLNSDARIVSSFNCTVQGNIPDGLYRINRPSTDGFNFTFGKDIEIKKGVIIIGNVDSTMNQYSNVYYSPLIIINSKEQDIQKGDKITFNVYPISPEQYNLENDEIILLNNNEDLSLYLKYCHQIIKNKTIYSVQCTVGNNMKGTYTKLYQNQIISLLDGQTLNLKSTNPKGGMIYNNFNHVVSSNMTRAQKNSYSLNFDVLYYDSNIQPSSPFPYKIYLYGNKKYSNKRLLYGQTTYDSRIILQNCTTGGYSLLDSKAIGSIKCLLPDYVQAGTYTKLESDGLDTNPQNKINLILNRDFNRSSSSDIIREDDTTTKSSSSGKSKKWVAWVIIIAAIIPLVGIVISILACGKKNDDEVSSERKNNDDSTAKQNDSS